MFLCSFIKDFSGELALVCVCSLRYFRPGYGMHYLINVQSANSAYSTFST